MTTQKNQRAADSQTAETDEQVGKHEWRGEQESCEPYEIEVRTPGRFYTGLRNPWARTF